MTTLAPSAETISYVGAWLIVGFIALIAFGVLSAIFTWLQTPSKPKAPKETEQEPLTWLPKKYVAADHR